MYQTGMNKRILDIGKDKFSSPVYSGMHIPMYLHTQVRNTWMFLIQILHVNLWIYLH